jgi:hypothetical protein
VEKPEKPLMIYDGVVVKILSLTAIIQPVHHTARFDAVIEHRHVLISNDTANWFEYPLTLDCLNSGGEHEQNEFKT